VQNSLEGPLKGVHEPAGSPYLPKASPYHNTYTNFKTKPAFNRTVDGQNSFDKRYASPAVFSNPEADKYAATMLNIKN